VIETTYTISQPEFIEAHKMWCSTEYKRFPGRTLQLVLCAFLGGAIGGTIFFSPPWLSVALYLSLFAMIFVSRWRQNAIRKYQFTQNAKQMEEVHVRFDDMGYHDEKADMCGGWIAWGNFSGWREGSTFFVIGRNLTFVTVPKAALTPEQQQELRSLLQSRLGASI
jgi:hypothetical protein